MDPINVNKELEKNLDVIFASRLKNIKDIKGVSVLEDSNNDLARENNLLDYPAIR